VWGTRGDDNIVWGTSKKVKNGVWPYYFGKGR